MRHRCRDHAPDAGEEAPLPAGGGRPAPVLGTGGRMMEREGVFADMPFCWLPAHGTGEEEAMAGIKQRVPGKGRFRGDRETGEAAGRPAARRSETEPVDRLRVDLEGGDLAGLDLRGADLRGANLRGVDLTGTD